MADIARRVQAASPTHNPTSLGSTSQDSISLGSTSLGSTSTSSGPTSGGPTLPNPAKREQLAEVFRLLGDPSRLSLLLACLDQPWAASELAAYCNQSPQAASHHLRLLKAARLVKTERQGKRVLYQAADDHVRHMLADMIEHLDEPHSHQESQS